MAVLDHPSFIQPDDMDIRVWRYMDLTKFISMIQKRTLVFPRADKLGDPFEGSVPLANADGAKLIQAMTPFRKIDGFKDIESLAKQFSEHRKQFPLTHYISCWHMNYFESAAMWSLYGKSEAAVSIVTTYRKLANSLTDECYMGKINYIDFKTASIHDGNAFNSFLIKRKSFEHENEARIIISNADGKINNKDIQFLEEPFDFSNVIDKIFINPAAPNWFQDIISNLLDRYEINTPIFQSELNGSPLY